MPSFPLHTADRIRAVVDLADLVEPVADAFNAFSNTEGAGAPVTVLPVADGGDSHVKAARLPGAATSLSRSPTVSRGTGTRPDRRRRVRRALRRVDRHRHRRTGGRTPPLRPPHGRSGSRLRPRVVPPGLDPRDHPRHRQTGRTPGPRPHPRTSRPAAARLGPPPPSGGRTRRPPRPGPAARRRHPRGERFRVADRSAVGRTGTGPGRSRPGQAHPRGTRRQRSRTRLPAADDQSVPEPYA